MESRCEAVVARATAPKGILSRHGAEVDLLIFSRGGSIKGLQACYDRLGDRTVQVTDRDGNHALHLAAYGGKSEACEFLIITCGSSTEVRNNDGETPLHLAAKRGHKETALLLIQLGADVNAKDNLFQETALHKASWEGHTKCIIPLLKNGADAASEDGDGSTPNELAKVNRKHEVIALFKSIQEKGKLKRRPLHKR